MSMLLKTLQKAHGNQPDNEPVESPDAESADSSPASEELPNSPELQITDEYIERLELEIDEIEQLPADHSAPVVESPVVESPVVDGSNETQEPLPVEDAQPADELAEAEDVSGEESVDAEQESVEELQEDVVQQTEEASQEFEQVEEAAEPIQEAEVESLELELEGDSVGEVVEPQLPRSLEQEFMQARKVRMKQRSIAAGVSAVLLIGVAIYLLFEPTRMAAPPTAAMMPADSFDPALFDAEEATATAGESRQVATKTEQKTAEAQPLASASNFDEVITDASAAAAQPLVISRSNPAQQHKQSLRKAAGLFQGGDYAAAKALYVDVIAVQGNNTDALNGLAAIALSEQQYVLARKYFIEVLAINESDSYARSGLLRLADQLSAGEREQELRAMAEKFPESGAAMNELGRHYAGQKRWHEAQKAFFQAHSLEPQNSHYQYSLAVALDHMGKQQLALQYYQRVLDARKREGVAGVDDSILQRIASLQAMLTEK